VIQEGNGGECSTWNDVITEYEAYLDGQVSWDDVVVCYNEYAWECSTWNDVITEYEAYVDGQVSWDDVVACYNEAVE
jgi:sirohydrochlorin ferrochelatase